MQAEVCIITPPHVRKGFETVVGAYGHIFDLQFSIAPFTLDDMVADHCLFMYDHTLAMVWMIWWYF